MQDCFLTRRPWTATSRWLPAFGHSVLLVLMKEDLRLGNVHESMGAMLKRNATAAVVARFGQASWAFQPPMPLAFGHITEVMAATTAACMRALHMD